MYFFLLVYFPQQIYNNYQLNCVALPFKHHYKILGLLFVALKVSELDVLICIHKSKKTMISKYLYSVTYNRVFDWM